MLRLHYGPGSHGNHVSDHRDQNVMDLRQREGPGEQTWQTVIAVDAGTNF